MAARRAKPKPIPKASKIWMDGKLVPWDKAQVHVLSHVIHYGSSVFEGLRCYDTAKGSACFRMKDHMERLKASAKIYRMEIPYSVDDLCAATRKLLRANALPSCYIRPIVFRGFGQMGVNPLHCPLQTVIAAWTWGAYLGDEAMSKGIDVCVTSWRRLAPNTMPSLAKAGGNYMNSQLMKMEAVLNGYAEAVALDIDGYVAEGSGENVFIVKDGGIVTPPSGASILPGITRHSVIQIAKEMKIEVRKQMIPREGLYIADEVFLTGSAAEITPVRSVDGIQVGNGRPGPISRKIRKAFLKIVEDGQDPYGWLDFV
ncbi:branched-chain amino acid transaminase [bacterium]|nr:branched-chain amino acid transaminase [bacterium]